MMEAITHSKIRDLVEKLPNEKLPAAYKFLIELCKIQSAEVSEQVNFMLLPLAERRRIMEKQAAGMVQHYKITEENRNQWQTGDFIDEY